MLHNHTHPRFLMRTGAAALIALVGLALGRASCVYAQPATEPAPQSKPAAAPVAQPSPTPSVDEDDRTELVVHLKDGRRFTGPVVRENAGEVVISIAGIAQRFATEEIERLEVLEPVMERYHKLREAVGDDPEQIVNLAEWLRQRGKYELALTEINRALTIDKSHGPSLKLRQLLEQQIILKHQRVKLPPDPSNPAEPHAPARPPGERLLGFPMLTPSDVKLMKIFETILEERPRVLIDRQTVAKMLAKYEGHPLVPITREGREALLRQSPLETLELMYKLQARDFYPDVEVLDQPRAFFTFKEQICRTWLINSCSTTLCHGGTEAGRLVLYNRSPNAEPTVYTNFYIISKFRLAGGTPLINWEEPEKSPLLQLGLPRDKSRRPHPVVPHGISGRDTFKPFFRTTDDVQFEQAVKWIKSLYRPRPEYPIVYIPIRPLEPPPISPPPAPKPGEAPPPAPNPSSLIPAGKPTTDMPSAPLPERKPEPKPR